MQISPTTLQVLQIELSKRFTTRDEKLDFLSQFVGNKITTSKDLSQNEALDVIRYLKTGQKPNATQWAYFDKNNRQHKQILSNCITYGWSVIKNDRVLADLNRLGTWLKSFRSPVNKPLLDMTTTELNTIINALNGMIKSRYK